jgi:hypothetical protein
MYMLKIKLLNGIIGSITMIIITMLEPVVFRLGLSK